jgi:hypothetical protein
MEPAMSDYRYHGLNHSDTSDDGAVRRPRRSRISIHLSAKVATALQQYVDNKRPKVTKAAVIRMVVEDFLVSRGFWPSPPVD